jgi:hypothetical protein
MIFDQYASIKNPNHNFQVRRIPVKGVEFRYMTINKAQTLALRSSGYAY